MTEKKFVMPTTNVVVISGRLVKEPQLRYATSGTAILSARIAHNRSIKDSSGNWHNEADFYNVVAFGKLAEGFVDKSNKGDAVIITGKIKQSKWTYNEGVERHAVEIIASKIDNIERLGAVAADSPTKKEDNELASDDVIPF